MLSQCRWPAAPLTVHRSPQADQRVAAANRPVNRVAVALAFILTGCGSHSTPPQTYSLNATVSGLTSSGLIVSANGADVTVPAGTASFTQQLAVSLPSGTVYSVTVKAQPTGQTCSVAAGNGSISSADASNIVVTCSNQAFALGGSVTGLTGSGLLLANGTDTVTVPSGATTFQLPTQVAYSSGYEVTVQAQPTGLACAVSGGTGAMPAAAVNTVAVSCSDQPFTLGGTVTDSPGVTLVNGTDTLLVPSVSGVSHFTMGQAVPFSSTYNLTVSNVPAGHTCTVADASGTMGAANKVDVTVTCATDAYTISGSVTGLVSGDTVILVNTNGDHTTIDPTKSSYTLTQRVAYGASYGITIGTQPAGKSCTVANSSSSAINSDVANVNVTCSVLTHTVGGTISGLGAATGLLLRNNGADDTIISANAATFTMTTGVAEGGHYAITVQTQPTAASVLNATAAIVCSLTGDSGPVVTSNVTNVVITCHNSVSFVTAGGPYTWTVPAGVSSVDIVAIGGGGGGGGSNSGSTGTDLPSRGGRGGMVSATLPVTSGNQLNLFVGGGGGGGAATASAFGGGGGGGGSSNVNPASPDQIIAGAGGGGGAANVFGPGGDGNGSDGTGFAAGLGGSNGVGGAGASSMFGQGGGDGGSGNGGGGAAGGHNNNGTTPGGIAGMGDGSGVGGKTDSELFGFSDVGGGGGGGFGGGGGSAGADSGGGGGGSTGPSGSVVSVVTATTGPGSAGAGGGVGAQPGTAGGDGSIVISY